LSVPNIGSGASQSLQPKTQSGGSSFPSKLQAQQSLASMQLLRSPGAVAETTQTSQPQTGSAQCAKDATSDTSFEQSYQLQQPDEPQLLPNLGFAASAGLQQPQAWSGVPSQVQVQEVVLPSSSPLQTTPFLLPESQQQVQPIPIHTFLLRDLIKKISEVSSLSSHQLLFQSLKMKQLGFRV
jgi:hypothetical protein